MKRLLLLLCIFSNYANAEMENWACSSGGKVIITLTGDFTNGLGGTIIHNGLKHTTDLAVTGLVRNWMFGGNNEKTNLYNYVFLIDSKNNGGYFDYSNGRTVVDPSSTFWCEKR